jgi:hypothetical protein
LGAWVLPASLLILLGLGLWVYRHRQGDLWVLLAVTALVARFWTYHMGYDDLLILLPMVALFRLAKHSQSQASGRDVVAGVLLAVTVVIMLVPHMLHRLAGLHQLSPPLNWLLTWGYAVVWLLILIFLLDVAHCELRERQAAGRLDDCPSNEGKYCKSPRETARRFLRLETSREEARPISRMPLPNS